MLLIKFNTPLTPKTGCYTEMAFQCPLLYPLKSVFFELGKQVTDAMRVKAFNNKTRFVGPVIFGESFIPLLFDVVRQTFDIQVHV